MDPLYNTHGFQVFRGVYDEHEVTAMRLEADRVADQEGSACVRRLREKSNLFDQLATSRRLTQLLPDHYSPVRSILFDKTAKENWPVTWHQDLTITVKEKIELIEYGPWSTKDGAVHVQPPEKLLGKMATLRIHLDDTPASNGALRIIPRSHLKGKIPSDDIRAHLDESEVVCVCAPGDVLLMSPLTIHSSRRSEAPHKRRVIHFEYAPLNHLDEPLSWHE